MSIMENELKNLKDHFESYLSKEPVFTQKDRRNIKSRIAKYQKRSFSFLPKTVSVIVLCSFIFFMTSFVAKQVGLFDTKSSHQGITKKSTAEKPAYKPVVTAKPASNPIIPEAGAQIKISKQADLFHTGEEYTVALVNLPEVSPGDYKGYLGIWDNKGERIKQFSVNGYNSMFPVQLLTQDLTKDGNPDILLETDEHANGGNGVHVAYVYVQQGTDYVEAPLPETDKINLTVSYNTQTKDFQVQSNENKTWKVKVDPSILESIDPNTVKQLPVNIDPISEVNTENNTLTTKRYLWFGNLQLNTLGFLQTSYVYKNGKWDAQTYEVVSGDMAIVTSNDLCANPPQTFELNQKTYHLVENNTSAEAGMKLAYMKCENGVLKPGDATDSITVYSNGDPNDSKDVIVFGSWGSSYFQLTDKN
jgi:hypothetical protein